VNSLLADKMNEGLVTRSDLKLPRTPSEFNKWWWKTYDDIRHNDVEVKKARLGVGYYSQFMKELFPLAVYAPWKYSDDVLVRPVVGNQGYDAEILEKSTNRLVHRVEVTWPGDGRLQKDVAHALNSQGYHEGHYAEEFLNYNRDIQERVLRAGRRKSTIDYRFSEGSTLLIAVDTTCSPLSSQERDADLEQLAQVFKKLSFLVDDVYLIGIPHFCICPVIEKSANQAL
jgi:hypothetical protein